jgi:CheY-like chemotaxis protein
MTETAVLEKSQSPTVYFIDDSATMREVMKIAFRRENIEVIACHDAAAALVQIEQNAPDLVITDVIMPDKDGFEVCQFIKQHAQLSKTPVVLLSGVVNREVADKAFSVKADELIRKPFQPQDLIARVKQLLAPKGHTPAATPAPAPISHTNGEAARAASLSGIFGSAPLPPRAPAAPPSALAASAPFAPAVPSASAPAAVAPPQPRISVAPPVAPAAARNGAGEVAKLRLEIMRLENLAKKLQSELVAERDYSRALEAHVKTLQDSD